MKRKTVIGAVVGAFAVAALGAGSFAMMPSATACALGLQSGCCWEDCFIQCVQSGGSNCSQFCFDQCGSGPC
jgi:hypothetical protein